ncbi:hypothetical protein DP23_4380 [Ralstonia pickettii]|nr:hypothetical protein DP23_4380 [Ralstonia pickettii]
MFVPQCLVDIFFAAALLLARASIATRKRYLAELQQLPVSVSRQNYIDSSKTSPREKFL